MSLWDTCEFDIHVDVGPVLGVTTDPSLIDSRWYQLAQPRDGRDPAFQGVVERVLRNELLRAQWAAARRRPLDRRRAIRVPLLARVSLDGGKRLLSTDISLSGLRCSGMPVAPLMDVEFRIPGLSFPIDTRVEVVSYRESRDFPWVGMRFVNIERPYLDHIARYIDTRTRRAA